MMTSMEPGEALGLAAQVAVTLAGFAGVVVVFRPHSVHQWSNVDRFRLRLLLNNSILPLALAVIGIFLLGMRPPPASIWRWCSAVATLCQLPFAIFNFTTVRKFSAVEFKGVNKLLFFSALCHRNRYDFAAALQHCGLELVLAVLRRDRRPSHRRNVAVYATGSSATTQ